MPLNLLIHCPTYRSSKSTPSDTPTVGPQPASDEPNLVTPTSSSFDISQGPPSSPTPFSQYPLPSPPSRRLYSRFKESLPPSHLSPRPARPCLVTRRAVDTDGKRFSLNFSLEDHQTEEQRETQSKYVNTLLQLTELTISPPASGPFNFTFEDSLNDADGILSPTATLSPSSEGRSRSSSGTYDILESPLDPTEYSSWSSADDVHSESPIAIVSEPLSAFQMDGEGPEEYMRSGYIGEELVHLSIIEETSVENTDSEGEWRWGSWATGKHTPKSNLHKDLLDRLSLRRRAGTREETDRRRFKKGFHVRFAMNSDTNGEVALCSLYPTYSPSEYDRSPLEPPSEAEKRCRLPERGSRCFDSGEGHCDEVTWEDNEHLEVEPVFPESKQEEDVVLQDQAAYLDCDSANDSEEHQEADLDLSRVSTSSTIRGFAEHQSEEDDWESWLDLRKSKSDCKAACYPCNPLKVQDKDDTPSSPDPYLLSNLDNSPSTSPSSVTPTASTSTVHLTYLHNDSFCSSSTEGSHSADVFPEEEGISSDTPSLTSTITASSTTQGSDAQHPYPALSPCAQQPYHSISMSPIDEKMATWLPHKRCEVHATEDTCGSPSKCNGLLQRVPKLRKKKKKRQSGAEATIVEKRTSYWASGLYPESSEARSCTEDGYGDSHGFGRIDDDGGCLGGF